MDDEDVTATPSRGVYAGGFSEPEDGIIGGGRSRGDAETD